MPVENPCLDCEEIQFAFRRLAESGTPPRHFLSLIDVGSAGYISFFKDEIVEGLLSAGGGTCKFFEGGYGSGKSHLLGILDENAQRLGLASIKIELSTGVSLNSTKELTKEILENICWTSPDRQVKGLPNILSEFKRITTPNLDALRDDPLSHPGFQAAMHNALSADTTPEALERYLLGEKVRISDLTSVGVYGVRDPLSERNAERVLATMAGGLAALGLPGTMISFDETERTRLRASQRSRFTPSQAANLIRRFIDGCVSGNYRNVVVVFSMLPGFISTCIDEYPALGSRLGGMRPTASSWRATVLSIQEISTVPSESDFANELIDRFCAIGERCNSNVENLRVILNEAAETVLSVHHGSGYRRPLVKSLAAVLCKGWE